MDEKKTDNLHRTARLYRPQKIEDAITQTVDLYSRLGLNLIEIEQATRALNTATIARLKEKTSTGANS